MQHDRDAVAEQPDVEFDAVTPGDDQRNLQDRQAVLGPPALITPKRQPQRLGRTQGRHASPVRPAPIVVAPADFVRRIGAVRGRDPRSQSAAWRNPTVRVRQKTAIE